MGKDTEIVQPGWSFQFDKPLMPYNNSHKYPEFDDSEKRFESFRHSGATLQPRAKEFAYAGFIYSGQLDCVCCFHCGVALKDWDREDPGRTHREFYPSCQFVTDCLQLLSPFNATSFTTIEGAICSVRYSNKDHRLQSLIHWSLHAGTKKRLATEGFYYTGFDDYVACACCYIKKHIHPESDLDYTHRPRCRFLSEDGDQARGPQTEMNAIHQRNTCIMCEDNKATMVFLPCNHSSMCGHCARGSSVCPLCATNVEQKIKTVVVQLAVVCS